MKGKPTTPEEEQAKNWRVYQTLTNAGKNLWIMEFGKEILGNWEWKLWNVKEQQVKEAHQALLDQLYSWLKRRYGIEPVFHIETRHSLPLFLTKEILFCIKSEQLEVEFILRQPLHN